MPSASDPIRALWLQTTAVLVVGVVCCAVGAVWAFAPIENRGVAIDWKPETKPIEPAVDEAATHGLIAAFDTRLWTAPERVEIDAGSVMANESSPPPPPKLLLIGIVSPDEPGANTHHAILYDPDTDTTHIAQRGDQIGSLFVGQVTADSAELIMDSGPVTLLLDTGTQQAARG